MSGRIAIVTDSTADLGALGREHGIEVVPLTIRFGSEEYRDGVDLSEDEFYRKLDTSSTTPITAQPTPAAFAQAYRRLLDGGADHIFSLHISGALSGTVNAAALAAREVDESKIRVIDTRSGTAGLGMLCLDAARRAAAGEPVDQIAAAIRADIPRIRLYATIPSLTYLARGGRIGHLSGLVGNVLQIVPILTLVDGMLKEHAKVRTFARAVDQIVAITAEKLAGASGARLVVLHSMAPALATSVSERVEALTGVHPLYVCAVGPTVGTHAGPGAVGTVFIP